MGQGFFIKSWNSGIRSKSKPINSLSEEGSCKHGAVSKVRRHTPMLLCSPSCSQDIVFFLEAYCKVAQELVFQDRRALPCMEGVLNHAMEAVVEEETEDHRDV